METGRRHLRHRLRRHHRLVSHNFHPRLYLWDTQNYSGGRLGNNSRPRHPNHLHHRRNQNYPLNHHYAYLSIL